MVAISMVAYLFFAVEILSFFPLFYEPFGFLR